MNKKNGSTKKKLTDSTAGEYKDRILVVDDDPAIRTLLYNMLTPHGYQVDLSEGSGDALEKLIDYRYQLLLLDARMPGISGFELLKYCKRHHPEMEIIMITGNPEIEDAISTVKDGAFDYLVKPFSMEKLLSRVHDAIAAQKKRVKKLSSPSKAEVDNDGNPLSPLPDYKVIKTLGTGTMGVVLLVEKDSIRYALKILRRADDDEAQQVRVRRFLQEAVILGRINNPHVVHIYKSSPPDAEVPFILMEYVEGRSLTNIIKNGSETLAAKVDIILQVTDALAEVHKNNIIHRDVKPGNILVTARKQAKLTDFGIARVADSSLTMTHEVLGSPAYMPPEAFSMKMRVDNRSDLFSLGVLFYELLTGSKPFHGDTVAEMMNEIQKTNPVDPGKLVPDLPSSLRNILTRLLRKDPALRYQTADELKADLELYKSGKKVKLHPVLSFWNQVFGSDNVWR